MRPYRSPSRSCFLSTLLAAPGTIALALLAAVLLTLPASRSMAQDAPAPSIAGAFGLLNSGDAPGAVAMMEKLIEADPENGRAWSMLGYMRQQAKDLDGALAAYLKAAEFPAAMPTASYNAGLVYGLKGNTDLAFEWLGRAKASGKIDMTQIELDPDSKGLRADPRYAALLPTREEYAKPFVENVTILGDWSGETAGDQFGWIARNIGDVDGDGVNDLVTSAPTYSAHGDSTGRIYTYSGRNGKLLWKADGAARDQLGTSVEAAGDVNADGVPDVIAGAPNNDKTTVFSGADGAVLLTLNGENRQDNFGYSTDVGDVNGDGHADVLVGASGNDGAARDAGRAYLYSGKNGSVLLTLNGESAGDGFGSAVAGRFADGRVTLVVGAPTAGADHHGRVYVYTDLSGSPAFVIESDSTGSGLGSMFLSVVGDVNGDGVIDVYASDWSNNALGRSTGRIYVHSGKDGSRLLTLTGEAAGDGFGIGPADAGDVNGDGCADLVIGAWRHSGGAPVAGKVYVHSGKDGALLSTITDRVQGETFGFDATGMGDVNGDGVIDYLLTSAWSAINGPQSGRVVLVSGKIGAAGNSR